MKDIIKQIFVLQIHECDKILQSASLKKLHVENGALIKRESEAKSYAHR